MRVVFALLAASIGMLAQTPGSLSGRVVDPSGAPVPNARISLTERDTQVRGSNLADTTGHFRFPALRTGVYLLEAQAEGFGTSEARQFEIAAGKSVEIELSLALERLVSRVQVTAAGIAQTVDEQSKALDIIDSAQLERRAEFSVTEALRSVPGVRVMQFGGPGSFSRIITRGTRATDTSVLVDGIRLRDAASPQGDISAFLGDLQLVNTERIEVLRGSGSSLYGTHATGGVVNIITRQGGAGWHGDLSTEGGGLGLFRGNARFSGATLQNRLRLSGGVGHMNLADGVDGDDSARNTTGHGFAQYQVGAATVLNARVLIAETSAALNDTPLPAANSSLPSTEIVRAIPNVTYTPAPNDPDQRRWGSTASTLFGLSHQWSPRVSSRVNYALVKTSRDNRDGVLGTSFEPAFPNDALYEGRIDTVQARTDVQVDRNHLLTGGYEFEREAYSDQLREENPNPALSFDARLRINQTSNAAFAQAQGRYLDGRLQLLVSGRVQRFALNRPTFSDNSSLYRDVTLRTPEAAKTGDASASYMIAKTSTKIRAHIGNGYRAPSLFERFGASFFGSFSAYGDPMLGPERLLSFDGGFDQYFASSRLRLSSTYFYTRIQEAIIFDFSGIIVPDTDPYSRWGGYRNTGGGLARGLEISAEVNPVRSLAIQAAYTYTNTDERRSQYGNTVLRGVRVSDHMFTATASQRIGKSFDVAFDLFAASDFLAPLGGRAFEFDGPVKADLVASYTRSLTDRQALRFYTRLENLLNRTYYEEGFRTPRAWAVAGVKWMF